MHYDDDFLRQIFADVKVIALVGASANEARPSHRVGQYLRSIGNRVIPVNPGLAGQELFGERVYGDLKSIPDDVDMIDIFRRSEAVPAIVDEALDRWPDLQVIWMQLGVEHAEAVAKAEARGVRVVQNRCPKIEIPRLS